MRVNVGVTVVKNIFREGMYTTRTRIETSRKTTGIKATKSDELVRLILEIFCVEQKAHNQMKNEKRWGGGMFIDTVSPDTILPTHREIFIEEEGSKKEEIPRRKERY